MPGMNVRGDRHLNFTREEASAWLGDEGPRDYVRRAADGAGGFGWVFIVLGVVVLLAIIGAAFSGSTQTQIASSASQTFVQPRNAVIDRTSTADATQPENISLNIPSQAATSQNIPSPVAYLPGGWFYGQAQGELPLSNKEGRSLGLVPDGTTFFGTTGASPVQIIVAADGSFWGYSELSPPANVSPIPITPAFENAARLIGQIEASGMARSFHIYTNNREEPEEAYLPAAWSMGCLSQDQPLTDRVNGAWIGTIKKGTRLLYQIANIDNCRLVVAADGSFWGYTCIRPLNGVPERTPMRPEYEGGMALIHRLENGAPVQELDETGQALARNALTPLPYGGEEH